MPKNIIALNSKRTQSKKPKTIIYKRLAGQPKPKNRLEFVGYCYA